MKTLTTNAKEYKLYWVRGKVEESGKNLETIVSGGGGGTVNAGTSYERTAPVSISTRTVVHDQIFLTDKNGKEHSFQLQDFNVACRNGNDLGVIWAIKRGKSHGDYFAVYNYSTDKAFFYDKAIYSMFRRPTWQMLLAVLACVLLGMYSSGTFFWGVFIIPIAWLVEGRIKGAKYRDAMNFAEFDS